MNVWFMSPTDLHTALLRANLPEALDDLCVQVTALDAPHLPRLHPQQLDHRHTPQIQATVRLLDVSHKRKDDRIQYTDSRSQQDGVILAVNKTPMATFDLLTSHTNYCI